MPIPISRRRFLGRSGAVALGLSPLVELLRVPESSAAAALKTDSPAETLIAALRKSIPELIQRVEVPGLSVAVIRDARILWSEGFGIRSTATREPVHADTVFEAASLSKPAFAYAFLKLCEARKIDLDAPLTDLLPESFVPDDPRLKLITTRRVLSHTSGLPHGRPPGTPIRLRFTPGERFAYSATGFAYLQLVAERLTQEPLNEFMRVRLLEPFGMRHSSFGWIDRYEKVAAQGHWQDGRPGLSGNGQYLHATPERKATLQKEFPEHHYPSAAAGLYTTAADYARFIIEVMQPSPNDRSHLTERMTAEMLRPQVHVADGLDWGLGWGLEQSDAEQAFWHWGDWGCFRSFAIAFRKQKLGAVVLTNSFNGPRAYREIVPQAIGGAHPAFRWIESYRP